MKALIQIRSPTPALMKQACTDRLVMMERLRRRAILSETESADVFCHTTRCFLETVQRVEIWLANPALVARLEPAEYLRLQTQVTQQVTRFGEYLADLNRSANKELEDYIFLKESTL